MKKNCIATDKIKKKSLFSPRILPAEKKEYFPAAIEIGSSSVKLMQIGKNKNRYEIAKIAYAPLDVNSQTRKALAIKDNVKKLVEENQIKGEVVSSLPINEIHILNYILPNIPVEEVGKAIAWKLKRNPPPGIVFDAVSFDYISCVNSKDEFNKEIRALAFVVSKEAVKERIEFFRKFSLELIALQPQPYAVFNALFWMGKIHEKETVLVLYFGADRVSISVVHFGVPYLIRPLIISGNTFTEAIANYYQFDRQKAEELKKREGLKHWVMDRNKEGQESSPESLCGVALASQLENVVMDIEHSFKYFSHQIMKGRVTSFDRLILCGGGAALSNLDSFLAERLVVPVDVFDPLSAFKLCLKQELAPGVKDNSFGFADVLGLAVRDIEW
ncbi:MAG: pilus assembly protein PilM [Candidatus Omnitrophota bacterium]|nr:pilus assembly protein PilM [Candidatus Omnitrophota bacterium]